MMWTQFGGSIRWSLEKLSVVSADERVETMQQLMLVPVSPPAGEEHPVPLCEGGRQLPEDKRL